MYDFDEELSCIVFLKNWSVSTEFLHLMVRLL